MFRHHPDGFIYLLDLQLPLDFWLTQEPTYTLPAPATGREYVQAQKHTLSDGLEQWAGDLPWAEGDRYLSQVDAYARLWELANTPAVLAPAPRWGEFRTAMLLDPDYRTMLITVMSPTFGGGGNWLGTTMQQAISMPLPAVALVAPLWNQIVALAPPPAAAVARWRSYVLQSHVELVFADDGTLSEAGGD
ncbi:MAG: hypothetical protein KME42_19705 [Tildeniella nuda ZEHNDER 1965/U140]|jgi:hypothetical protein|nr:hypothetical protein [Tildeniella nuda ZEHNDER 1965/U140]